MTSILQQMIWPCGAKNAQILGCGSSQAYANLKKGALQTPAPDALIAHDEMVIYHHTLHQHEKLPANAASTVCSAVGTLCCIVRWNRSTRELDMICFNQRTRPRSSREPSTRDQYEGRHYNPGSSSPSMICPVQHTARFGY